MTAKDEHTTTARPRATFFLSTGRCGTQWLAASLAEHYGDIATVDHEPMSSDYQARHYFGAYHRGERPPELSPLIEQHLETIATTIEERPYIETGWPIYGALPFILERFRSDVRVVHLYRHPVTTAASIATHQVFDRDEWTDAVTLTPEVSGVAQPHLAGRAWERMSDYEKCLFWWAEVNQWGFELREQFPDVPWFTLSFEDMFGPDGDRDLRALLEFMELPERESFLDSRRNRVDGFVRKSDDRFDGSLIRTLPKAIEVMESLGYDSSVIVEPDRRRYHRPLKRRIKRRLRRWFYRLTGRELQYFER